jgi:predicted restriction endonuclease
VFCGYNDAASREAAHLFELKNCQGTIAVKEKQLNGLGLENINSISNMVSLCSNCHTKFDSYAIGIDPDQTAGCFFLKVSESIDSVRRIVQKAP